MKVLSLYCGAGGIDEGLKQAGIKTTLAIDSWSDAIETMKLNHICETIVGKVGDYLESFSDFDIIVGGPPCPEFSRAKLNRTFDMCEVDNFWNVIEKCKPKYYMMENVQDVKKKLYKGSYLVNCADYGIPQVRLRRFFTNLPLPEPTHSEKPNNTLSGLSLKKWVSVKESLGIDGVLQDRKTTFGEGFRDYDVNNPSISLVSDARIWILSKLKEKNPIMYEKHKPNDINKPCCTVAGKDRTTDGYVSDGQYARKLNNEELAILQGFPKDYKFYGNKTSVRKQIGNAVPPGVIKAFFQQVTLPLIREVKE